MYNRLFKFFSFFSAALIFSISISPVFSCDPFEEETEYFEDDPLPSVSTAPLVTEAPPTSEPDPIVTTAPEISGSLSSDSPVESDPPFTYPPIVFQFPEVTSPEAQTVAHDDGIMTMAIYEGSGLYHILKEFIGVTFDGTQNYNEYQYLYPASVIIAVVIIVLVAKVIFTIVDRLL